MLQRIISSKLTHSGLALTTEAIHPSAAILFRYRSKGSRDSAVSIYLEVTSRPHLRVRLPFLAVTSPFHSHTPRIKTKPKTLSRQNECFWMAHVVQGRARRCARRPTKWEAKNAKDRCKCEQSTNRGAYTQTTEYQRWQRTVTVCPCESQQEL
jgi:hypothetical protein